MNEPPALRTPPCEPRPANPALRTPALRTPALRTPALRTPALRTPALRTPAAPTPALPTHAALTPHLPPEAPGAWRRCRTRVHACLARSDPNLCAFVEDSDRGFTATVGALEWDVRAWIYRPAREAPLLAEFKAKVAHPLPWRPELTHPPLSPLSPLPADAADEFEIRLPGKVLPRPLRFERRRLDAGLAPFNC